MKYMNQKKDRTKKEIDDSKNKLTLPLIYPDSRYEKSNVAKPSDLNVEHAREWVNYDEL